MAAIGEALSREGCEAAVLCSVGRKACDVDHPPAAHVPTRPSACPTRPLAAAPLVHLGTHRWQAGERNSQGCGLHWHMQALAQQKAQCRRQQALGAAQPPEWRPVVHALRWQGHLWRAGGGSSSG